MSSLEWLGHKLSATSHALDEKTGLVALHMHNLTRYGQDRYAVDQVKALLLTRLPMELVVMISGHAKLYARNKAFFTAMVAPTFDVRHQLLPTNV